MKNYNWDSGYISVFLFTVSCTSPCTGAKSTSFMFVSVVTGMDLKLFL